MHIYVVEACLRHVVCSISLHYVAGAGSMALLAMAYIEMLLITTVRILLQLISPFKSNFCSIEPSDC